MQYHRSQNVINKIEKLENEGKNVHDAGKSPHYTQQQCQHTTYHPLASTPAFAKLKFYIQIQYDFRT